MNFITPDTEELIYLRPDPLLWEQELDHWPEVADEVEKASRWHCRWQCRRS